MTANARTDFINAYRVVEFVTLTGDGAPVCWPMSPGFENGKITFTTGYMYPTKARNAQRNPHVCALFSDPSGTGRSDTDPLVLVQGRAEVLDQDLQRNTERYVDWLLQNTPPVFSMMLRIPLAPAAVDWVSHAHLARSYSGKRVRLGTECSTTRKPECHPARRVHAK